MKILQFTRAKVYERFVSRGGIRLNCRKGGRGGFGIGVVDNDKQLMLRKIVARKWPKQQRRYKKGESQSAQQNPLNTFKVLHSFRRISRFSIRTVCMDVCTGVFCFPPPFLFGNTIYYAMSKSLVKCIADRKGQKGEFARGAEVRRSRAW